MPASNRSQRLQDLQNTARDYFESERTRAGNEVQVLEAVLNGRTGGQGIQQSGVEVVAAVADQDLASYLKGS